MKAWKHLGALLLLSGVGATSARAQSTTPPLSEWHHTAFTGDRGPPVPGDHSILRSSDGYLWLSAIRSILRFDGVRFTAFDSTNTPALRHATTGGIFPQLIDHSGTMWLSDGNNHWIQYRDGNFSIVASGDSIAPLGLPVEDGLGRFWTAVPRARLWKNGKFLPAPLPPGVPDSGLSAVIRDNANGIWIGTRSDELWHVTGSKAERFVGAQALRPKFHASDGTLWGSLIGPGNILGTFRNGVVTRARLNARDSTRIIPQEFKEAPDKSIWIATIGAGVLRWRNGIFEQFTRRDGLSSESVHSLWIDAEGSAWISTDAGLDRLRPTALLTVNEHRGLPFSSGYAFVEDNAHALWARGLQDPRIYRLSGGPVAHQPGPVSARAYDIANGDSFQLLSAAREGGIWVAPVSGGLLRIHTNGSERFGKASGLPDARLLLGMTARSGALWLTLLPAGLGCFEHGKFRPVTLFHDKDTGVRDMVEDEHGNVWVLTRQPSRLGMVQHDTIGREVRLPPSGENSTALALEGADTLWIPTRTSVIRVVNGVATDIPLPQLKMVLSAASDAAVSGGSLWLNSIGGIARLSLAELHRAATDKTQRVTPTVFSSLDGVDIPKATDRAPFKLGRASDGRVWFATPSGLAVADPAYAYRNTVPVEPRIEEVTVSDSLIVLGHDGMIAPKPDRISIHFTAPSLGLAERVRLEFMLEGADQKWNDGSTARVATYTQLGPGTYTFHVRAWNENGVPGTHEATLRFHVLRAWYQSFWFYGLCVALLTALIYAVVLVIQRERLRDATRRTEARFKAVLDERTRIARELHDTLLQGFTGITLHLETVRGKLMHRSDESASELSDILTYADSTLREAREMVWDIRAPELHVSLLEAIEAEGRRVLNGDQVQLRYTQTGTVRRLQPFTETTVVRIARESLANALKHADPATVTVALHFAPRAVSLTISDDGRGADAARLEQARAGGHFGLSGMKERAARAGGTVEVETAPGAGMRVTLVLPTDPGE